MYLLFPGRHQLLTDFQFKYLYRLLQSGLVPELDVNGQRVALATPVQALIFAVTSANHSNTRRNPLPFYLRALMLQDFARELPVPAYIFGIDEVGILPDFASYTLKRIKHDSDGLFTLTPENTLVVCSTPVMQMYEALGFTILPAELADRKTGQFQAPLPWDIVEQIAYSGRDWQSSREIMDRMHPASFSIWKRYHLGERVQMLFRDRMISDDGDITTTRDYNSYVRQMDEIAELKYHETASFIRPGRIGDIGCAVGSWIKLACEDPLLRESDFYGIEVARHLYDICQQRKHNGEYINPFVFFAQKNAVTGLVFDRASMHTIHTSSLTHEIESYGSRADLLSFIRNRYEELAPGGVWINRDVVGPDDPEREVWLWLNQTDGRNDDWEQEFAQSEELAAYLNELSTFGRFLRFTRDFRRREGEMISFVPDEWDGKQLIRLTLRNAAEFLTKKDYTDNWNSEMHEKFCFWSFAEWKQHVEAVGFTVLPVSRAYRNEWIVEHRFTGKASLYQLRNGRLELLDFPVTHMFLLAEKRLPE